ADLFRQHAEAGADVAEQRHRGKLGGIEDECGQGQGNNAEPAALGSGVCSSHQDGTEREEIDGRRRSVEEGAHSNGKRRLRATSRRISSSECTRASRWSYSGAITTRLRPLFLAS